MAVLLG